MGYWVYENFPNNKAMVHMDSCGFCNYGEGVRGRSPGTGEWHGPFESGEEASAKAWATGRSDVRGCKFCAPAGQHEGGRSK